MEKDVLCFCTAANRCLGRTETERVSDGLNMEDTQSSGDAIPVGSDSNRAALGMSVGEVVRDGVWGFVFVPG